MTEPARPPATPAPEGPDARETPAAVQELLRKREEIERLLSENHQRFCAILFTDIKGSTAYFEKHGDLAGRAMIQKHNDLLFPIIGAAHGRVLKTIGDAIMAVFDQPRDAVEAAVQMQQALRQHNSGTHADHRIRIRIGVHCGKVLVDEKDVYGDAVNVAARVEAAAKPEEILVSSAVRAELGTGGPPIEPRGAAEFRGKSARMELYAVLWQEVVRRQPSRPPEVDARWAVEELVGVGGMATVWRARDRRLGRSVALKVLHRHLDMTKPARERFQREARLAAGIGHPNVVEIFDVSGDESAESYFVMELLEGRSLRQQLQVMGSLAVPDALAVMHEVALGLGAAHARGVVHRDLKPDNVFLRRDGVVKLADFGIASLSELARLTITGSAIGTPDYMSPEQARGEVATAAQDVFALGVTLYEVLCGRLPFGGAGPLVVLQRIAAGNFDEPSPHVGPEVTALLRRALAPEPAQRPADANAFAVELRALLVSLGLPDPREAASRFVRAALAAPTGQAGPAKAPPAPIGTPLPMTLPAGVPTPGLVRASALTPGAPVAQLGTAPRTAEVVAAGAPSRWPLYASVAGLGAGLLAVALWTVATPSPQPPPAPTPTLTPPPTPTPTPPTPPTPTPTPTPTPPPTPAPALPPTPPPTPAPALPPTPTARLAPPTPPTPPTRPTPPTPAPDAPVPPPAAPASQDPATLKLHIHPWGDVYVDGVRRGKGVMDLDVTLAPGPHTVRVVHPSLEEQVQNFTLAGGEVLDHRIRLQAKAAP